ncbi:hypothetical protein [Bacillus alkalicellulosilyticus]|uniref:hypothetical protein n=1 Tax=Alkalihalobacterium alkalicellulosilyticum TaxID=1912214 RepID=UPI0009970DDE|nr:hypothetical protein [Bacillus alkalicellulosilyticus]
MGTGIRARCNDCWYSRSFMLGVGMHHSTLENCIGCVNKNSQRKINDLLTSNELVEYKFEYVLAHCQSCFTLMDRPLLKLTLANNQTYQSDLVCKSCRRKQLKVIEPSELENIPCPSCRKTGAMKGENDLLWD